MSIMNDIFWTSFYPNLSHLGSFAFIPTDSDSSDSKSRDANSHIFRRTPFHLQLSIFNLHVPTHPCRYFHQCHFHLMGLVRQVSSFLSSLSLAPSSAVLSPQSSSVYPFSISCLQIIYILWLSMSVLFCFCFLPLPWGFKPFS